MASAANYFEDDFEDVDEEKRFFWIGMALIKTPPGPENSWLSLFGCVFLLLIWLTCQTYLWVKLSLLKSSLMLRLNLPSLGVRQF